MHFQAPEDCSVDEAPRGKYTASTGSRAWVNEPEDKAKVQKWSTCIENDKFIRWMNSGT